MTDVVCICSESTVTMANGSGRRRISRLMSESAATTASQWRPAEKAKRGHILVMRIVRDLSRRGSDMIESPGGRGR